MPGTDALEMVEHVWRPRGAHGMLMPMKLPHEDDAPNA